MTTPHGKDREERIRELKQRAERVATGEMIAWESDELSTVQREQFWERVVAFETAPSIELFRQLIQAGVELPDPDAVDDKKLRSTLWEVIAALARMRVFLSQTDHLSDRELYTLLWRDLLREEYPMLPDDVEGAWHVDILGGWSDEDTRLYLRYYADEEWRRYWLTDFPDYPMPAHEDPPFDRDSHLPKPHEEQQPN